MYANQVARPERSRREEQVAARPPAAVHQHVARDDSPPAHRLTGIDTSQRNDVLQRRFEFSGFDKETQKFADLENGLTNAANQYVSHFSRSKTDVVWLRLDAAADKNPGDASILIKAKAGDEFEYMSPQEWRKLDKVAAIGARVNVRKWFYDDYSSGKILAMVAHEFGVHVVPYMDELFGLLHGQQEGDPTKVHGRAGITDHLRVADVKHEDFMLYRGVVAAMMLAVMGDEEKEGRDDREATARDLADAYLLDLATFAKSGARIALPYAPEAIAERYNAFASAEPELPLRMPKKTKKDVVGAYGTLYQKVLPVALKQHAKAATAIAVLIAACLAYFLLKLFSRD